MRQFSIRTLMVVIVVSALSLVAGRHVHYWWAGVLLLMAAAAAEIAILGAILLRGSQRAWLVGFALFTGGYLVFTLDPWLSANLSTTYVLRYAYAGLAPADLEHGPGRRILRRTGRQLQRRHRHGRDQRLDQPIDRRRDR